METPKAPLRGLTYRPAGTEQGWVLVMAGEQDRGAGGLGQGLLGGYPVCGLVWMVTPGHPAVCPCHLLQEWPHPQKEK